MNINELISQLVHLDVRLWVEEGRLRLNAPKGVLTPELRETLSAHKEEIIAVLQSMNANIKESQPSILEIKTHASTSETHFPLSFSQMRLWFLEQFDPGNAAYSVPFAIKLEGDLDKIALEKSINEIVRRQNSLRTILATINEQPVQIVQPFRWQELPIIDLTHLPDPERESASLQTLSRLSRIPFDLLKGPLFQINLIRCSNELHFLLFNTHHIISDGWSVGVLLQELAQLYQAFLSGGGNPLQELAVQYGDFAVWQRQSQKADALNPQFDYWKRKLKGYIPILDLPADHPRPKFQSSKGRTHSLVLSLDFASQLSQLGKKYGSTLFMSLFAAFNILLYRYTAQEDLIVGTAVANRTHQEIEKLIGFFMNTLALRNDLSGNPSFFELLKRVQNVSLEAFENQDLPFVFLVEALHPDRDVSHSPIFQVMFIFQKTTFQGNAFPGLKATPVYVDNGTSKYDLTLTAWESPEGLTCHFEYNTDLFEAETIERMAHQYQTLLEGICAHPEQPISQLPLLTPDERRQILVEWNDTRADFPRHLTLPALFEAQAQLSPQAVAICDEQEQITYTDLDRRANRLARFLHNLGVGPEVLVGVCLPRSIDMVVSLLAILKAGGAYLPLDPNFPPDRLAFMLTDSGAHLLLTHSSLAALFPAQAVQSLCLDTLAPAIDPLSSLPFSGGATPESLAYLLYTSGSTGQPKGVQVLQRNLVNFLTSMRRQPGIAPSDVLLSVTTLSFDIAGLELYLPLISGARLVLVSAATAADGYCLKLALEQSGATFMQATPATWRLLLGAGWQGSPQFKILCGGEALPPDLAASLLGCCAELWNMYGPTETTIWSTLARISSTDEPITIGRPIANTQVYLLDHCRQPLPPGIPGELFIGGEGVARGYLNRPELNAEKFIPDPFSSDPQARLYRTGDLARYHSNGLIEFFGRIDYQVKLRGFRIELGEIESVLTQHPAIRQAVVIDREDTPGDKRLVAYLTLHAPPPPSASELRAFLSEKLPEYMLPSIFVTLDNFPLTPNGKVNRRALPAPESSRPDLTTSFMAPRTETENMLSKIWQESLKIEKVGINDNFFELGGHSLLITQIHYQISQKFQTDLSIAQMFQFPTIQSLAQYLDHPHQDKPEQPRHNIQTRASLQKEAIIRQARLPRSEGEES